VTSTSLQSLLPKLTARTAAAVRRAVGARYRVTAVAGDASTRRFYRARGRRGSVILVIHPPPLEDLAPFRSSYRILKRIGAPVPPLIAGDDRSGVVIVEDLGNTTLQRHLRTATGRSSRVRSGLYRQACDLIILLQRRAQKVTRATDFAAKNALDRERFLSELDHFHRYFTLGLHGMRPGSADAALLRRFYADLAEDCSALTRVFCHRDFQSRNLMVRRGRLYLIDFQDARMGPYTYDAASLLRDSSLNVGEKLVEEMTSYLALRLGWGIEEFRRDFDLVALQRNIKDLGTFAFMATERGHRSYLDYVPRTLHSIRRTLVRSPRYDLIYPYLDKYVLSFRR
jgi:aminoglycoside/choline kinase family phosphotransferase